MSNPPTPTPSQESLILLNAFLLLITRLYPLFSPSTPIGLDSTSLLHLHISHTLLLPSRPSLFLSSFHPMLASHMLQPFTQRLPLKIQTCKAKPPVSTSNSPLLLIPFSFCPFTNLVCLILSIIVGPGSSVASRQMSPTFLSSFLLYPFLPFSTWLGCLPTGALMQRSWTVSKTPSASIDARWKYYRSRHFSWSVCSPSLLVFDSTWSRGPLVPEHLNRNMEICLHFLPKSKGQTM